MEKKNKEANIKLKKKNQEVVDLNEEKEAALVNFSNTLSKRNFPFVVLVSSQKCI